MRLEHLGRTPADFGDKVFSTIKTAVIDALPQALADTQDALDANMGTYAEKTFATSMALAGIEAANNLCGIVSVGDMARIRDLAASA